MLQEKGMPRPGLDADLLLATALKRDRAYLIAHSKDGVTSEQENSYFSSLAKRLKGVPIQYIRGRQEFWGRDFQVSPDVMIPRPESELIVEQALLLCEKLRAGSDRQLCIADIGTGSGCLAVTLAVEGADVRVFATDVSAAALKVARANAARYGVAESIEFRQGDLGKPLLEDMGRGSVDLIVSNPPYGAENSRELFQAEVLASEPHQALFGGRRGTETIERLIPQAYDLLGSGGGLLLEMGFGQESEVMSLFENGWVGPEVYKDLQGISRCIGIRKDRDPVNKQGRTG